MGVVDALVPCERDKATKPPEPDRVEAAMAAVVAVISR
jgi:hypothetical protein